MITLPRPLAGALPALLLALSGCTASSTGTEAASPRASASKPSASAPARTTLTPTTTSPELVRWPASAREPANRPPVKERPPVNRFAVSVPAIGLRSLPVVVYPGKPDDGPGTRIQDGGIAASPIGADGGERLGEIGNLIVTAHRTTAGAPFGDLPALRNGERVEVTAGGLVYVYEVTGTRQTSFRSQRSLAEQAAAVPGHPGRRPTRSVITLSTCATPEDRAAGNFWSDQYGNPEHRIDKIGVLVEIRAAA